MPAGSWAAAKRRHACVLGHVRISDQYERSLRPCLARFSRARSSATFTEGGTDVDLKKEIHFSDLFRRTAKDSAEKPPKEEKPRKRGRKEKPPKAPKEPGRDKAASTLLARSAPPLRQVPLMRPFNLLPKEVTRQTRDTRALVPYVLVALLGLLVVAGHPPPVFCAGGPRPPQQGGDA